jgi:hypothetical protein
MALDDALLKKSIPSIAQLLSNALHPICANLAPLKKRNYDHPCSFWVRGHPEHYKWLLDHFKGLCNEYRYRFGKSHPKEKFLADFAEGLIKIWSFNRMFVDSSYQSPHLFFHNPFGEWEVTDPVVGFRDFLNTTWDLFESKTTWTKREAPNWRTSHKLVKKMFG